MKDEQAPWQKLGFKLKLGLRARDEADWLPYDDLFDDHAARDSQLDYKAQLLGDRHNEVFAALPESEPAGREVLAMVRAHLQQFHDASLSDMPANAGLHPLDAAARLVPLLGWCASLRPPRARVISGWATSSA